MVYLFSIIFFLSPIVLIAGLIRPSIFKKIFKTIPKRKTIALVCSGAIVFSFIGVGIFAPDVERKNDINIAVSNPGQQITQQQTTTTTETVIATSAEAVIADSDDKIDSSVAGIKLAQPEELATTSAAQTNPLYEYYPVSSIVDGDTIKVDINGKNETIRLIGIDTPEVVDPRKPVQCFGQEASNKAKELLGGKKVRIEKDPTHGDRDKYNRLLAYIYREDGLFYNQFMIEQGYAHEYTYNTPYKYQAEFKAAEKLAKGNQRGLWSPNACNGTATAVATNTASTTSSQTATTNQLTEKYYTSSYQTAKYYYPESCLGWKNLTPSYLKVFDSLAALLVVYPSRTLSPQCQ
ncbi:MAG: thermonuclease family protein [Patescibacteria group bacterium]|nr:thermonuclease family protein [Patescibacteria group bacterium]